MESLKAVTKDASKLEHDLEERLTILWHELQEWQRDNHHILSGYRPASNSYRKSWWRYVLTKSLKGLIIDIASLTYLHNESVNIYTHLIGTFVSIITSAILYQVLAPRYQGATKEDVFVFGCFFFGAACCLGMSATYHTISNHSLEIAKFGNQLDYLGIVILIWGSFIPSIYYGFRDDVRLTRIYWTMITTIGAGTALVTAAPKFRTAEWRPFRAAMFVAMGLSAIFPVIHGLQTFGVDYLNKSIALPWLVTHGVLYIVGAAIYAVRIPERWAPGRFDIWGNSHQIFHVLVLIAAATHLTGLVKAFDNRHSLPATKTPPGLF